MNKREFLKGAVVFIPAAGVLGAVARHAAGKETPAKEPAAKETRAAPNAKNGYEPSAHYYGMGIDIDKCIGCNLCAVACKVENDVPDEPFYFRTWVERYTITRDGEVSVGNISLGTAREPMREPVQDAREVVRTFFVPKLCNQCQKPPCVQVCPVNATFTTQDGVVIIDAERCIGCRYCIQACPYGQRYLHPKTRVADKCTFCLHRLVKGLQPACVEVCPTQARIFGDLRSHASRLVRFRRLNKLHVLKPQLNTDPKVYYANLDGEVR